MTIPQQDLNRVIVVALERLSHAFRTLLWDYAKQERLSPIQIQFLVFLAAHPDQKSYVTEIAREFNLTTATVSDAISSLETKGLIQKTITPKDKRRFKLELTSAGIEITKKLTNWQNTMVEHIEQFAPTTKKTVMLFLFELVESLKNGNVLKEVKTCLSCNYFERDVNAEHESPHVCALRNVDLNNIELRLDCPNYKHIKSNY